MTLRRTGLGLATVDENSTFKEVETAITDNATVTDDLLAQVIPDVEALKKLGGLAPGDLSDATMTMLVSDPDSDFSAALATSQAENITTPGTVVNTALNATIASETTPLIPKLIDNLPAKFYIAHRGGPSLYPEHSMEGYRASAHAGFVIEPDLQVLSDGTIVCLHDTGTNRTMTGPDVVGTSLNRSSWLARRVKPAIPGGKSAMPILWDDVLGEFGGRFPLMPEIKSSVAAGPIIDSIVSRGLERSVCVQSFDINVATQAANAGIASAFLVNTSTDRTPEEILSRGIEFIGCSTATSLENIAAWTAAGLKVLVFTVTSRSFAEGVMAAGAVGVFTDDPWFVSGLYADTSRDEFATMTAWPGYVPKIANPEQLISAPDGTTRLQISNNDLTLLGQFGTLDRTQKLSFKYRHMAEGTASHAFRVYLHQTPKVHTEAENNWYLALFRRNGGVDIYEKSTGSIILRSPTSGSGFGFVPAVADATEGTDTHVEIELTSTQVIIRRLDTGEARAYDTSNVPGPFYVSMGTLTANATAQVYDILKR